MATSILEQFRISDLLEWHNQKKLITNPVFQRRNIWTVTAKVFLIDTILRQLSMPKIYMRTKIDLLTKTSYREIVDGQQRLRAIFEFASDELTLTSRANEYEGLKYSSLSPDLQEIFLSYPIAVEQLINASDSDVLEIFARLNSYTLTLNAAEMRHAKFQGDFRWAVHESSKRWSILWEKYKIVSIRERLRMLDDSLMAEMFGVLLEGVKDGGQAKINKLYESYDKNFPQREGIIKNTEMLINYIINNFDENITGHIASPPHFLMLFAAVAHALIGIKPGDIGAEMPTRDIEGIKNISLSRENLEYINSIFQSEEAPQDKEILKFWQASKASTQRISSRKIRFPFFYKALLPERIY